MYTSQFIPINWPLCATQAITHCTKGISYSCQVRSMRPSSQHNNIDNQQGLIKGYLAMHYVGERSTSEEHSNNYCTLFLTEFYTHPWSIIAWAIVRKAEMTAPCAKVLPKKKRYGEIDPTEQTSINQSVHQHGQKPTIGLTVKPG